MNTYALLQAGKATSDLQQTVFIKERCDQLMEQLSSRAGAPFDISDWCSFFAFDVMGASRGYSLVRFLFGTQENSDLVESFGMLDSGETHSYVHFIDTAMRAVAVLGEIPWLVPLLTKRTVFSFATHSGSEGTP